MRTHSDPSLAAGQDGAQAPNGQALAPGEEPAAPPPGHEEADTGAAGGLGARAGRAARAGSAGNARLGPGGLKNWRVRSRLLLLIAIPTVTALVLGSARIASSLQSALTYQRAEERAVLAADITVLAQHLEDERDETVYYIASGINGGRGNRLNPKKLPANNQAAAQHYSALKGFYRQTDQIAAQVKSLQARYPDSFSPLTQQEVAAGVAELHALPYLRKEATSTLLAPLVVVQKYADLIDGLLVVEDQTAQGTGDTTLSQTVEVLGLVSRMKEQASEQRAILAAGLLRGNLSPGEAPALGAAQAGQASSQQTFNLTATPAQLQQWNTSVSGSFVDLAAAEEQQAESLQAHQRSLASDPTSAQDWYGAMSNGIDTQMGSVERSLADAVIARTDSLRRSAVTSALLVGLAVALVLGLAVVFTVVVGRSMVRPLRRLRAGALEVAGARLPEMVRRMSEGDGGDGPVRIEPIDVDSTDEIGEVARAFDQVHREAVRLAANEAALRGNVNAMFVNLSRRSQSLVERQIRLIDDLEQGEQDSERLGNLFQMDHLATRMRRNSENLLVLAGHEVSRRRTEAVALVDVLRAAVSEIEQYGRVTLNVQPGLSVRGQAVNDVVHLLAELVENATSFSAADTPVSVSGHLLNSGGVLLEITDEGVGMGTEEMAHANWRLDNPPVVDVAVARRMGLFVVARLAARHGIRVRLRPAPAGGLTALVWLPDEVISHDSAPSAVGPRQFDAPAASAPPAPGMGTLGDWPVASPDDRAAAVRALSAARTPRFAPLRPDLGEAAAFSLVGPDVEELPPADTTVADPDIAAAEAGESGAGDLVSGDLVADGGADGPTAEAEPAEPAASASVPALGSPVIGPATVSGAAADGPTHGDLARPFALRAPDLTAPSAGDQPGAGFGAEADGEPGQPAQKVIVPPAVSAGDGNRLPIFESVESDWFRRGRHGAERPGSGPVTTASGAPAGTASVPVAPAGWTSPADEGWRAAEVAQAPVSGGTTGAGLPKRVPKANLVPGGVGAGSAPAPPAPARSAVQARERLASFQRGVRQGRSAAANDETPSGEENGG